MTWHESAAHGHQLKSLFEGLPDPIQKDISERYADVAAHAGETVVLLYALQWSPVQPENPPRWTGSNPAAVVGLMNLADNEFIRSRYFFEKGGDDDWKVLVSPITQMRMLSEVLDTVYNECVARGRWG